MCCLSHTHTLLEIFFLPFLKETLYEAKDSFLKLRCNSHSRKYTILKHSIQWVLVCLLCCATLATNSRIFLSFQRETPYFPVSLLILRQPLICFLSLQTCLFQTFQLGTIIQYVVFCVQLLSLSVFTGSLYDSTRITTPLPFMPSHVQPCGSSSLFFPFISWWALVTSSTLELDVFVCIALRTHGILFSQIHTEGWNSGIIP